MNPTRDKIDGNLAALIDGTLPPDEAAQVKAWLDADPQLSEQVAGMMADRDALRGIPKMAAPTGLAEGVLAQLERGTLLTNFDRDITVSRGRFRNRLAIAALIAIVVGGFSYVVVQGVTSHKGPWGEWANSQIAGNPKKESLKELLPSHLTDVGALAAADKKKISEQPLDAATTENKAGSKIDAVAAAPPAVTTPAASPAITGGESLLASAAGKADAQGDRDALQKTRRLEFRKDSAADQLADEPAKDPANTKAALDDLACVNVHFPDTAPPLTLALTARDSVDGVRLQQMLQTFADNSSAANRGGLVISGANTYSGGTNISAGTLNIVNGNNTISSNGATTNAVTGNSSNGSGGNTINNDGYAHQQLGAVADNGKTTQNTLNEQRQASVSNSGGIIQQATPSTSQSRERLDQQVSGQLRSGAGLAEGQVLPQVNGVGNIASSLGTTTPLQNEDGRPLAPGTYHVKLTPQQVESLISAFTVRTVSRGDVVFNIDPNHPTAATSYASNFNVALKPAAHAAATLPAELALAPAAAATPAPAPAVRAKGALDEGGASGRAFKGAPSSTVEKTLANDGMDKSSPQLVDCIITIAPPAPTTAPIAK